MKTKSLFEIPPIIKKFIDDKIVCPEIPLLPCIYGDFEKMQIGYRWNPIQKCSLVTNKPGGWKENWYVIAQNALGDPFFVDFTDKKYPVYTATHGMGDWNAIKIAESIVEFSKILNKIVGMNLIFPCSLTFLEGIIDLENEFWIEVNEVCQGDQ